MTKYDIILEELQNRVDSGEISYEFAESVNELAYEKYVSEGIKDMEYLDPYALTDIKSKIKSVRAELKQAKKNIKNMKDKSDCTSTIKSLKKCKDEIKDVKEAVNKLHGVGPELQSLDIVALFLDGIAIATAVKTVSGINKEEKNDKETHHFDKAVVQNKRGKWVDVYDVKRQNAIATAAGVAGVTVLLKAIQTMRNGKFEKTTILRGLDGLDKLCDDLIKKCNDIK